MNLEGDAQTSPSRRQIHTAASLGCKCVAAEQHSAGIRLDAVFRSCIRGAIMPLCSHAPQIQGEGRHCNLGVDDGCDEAECAHTAHPSCVAF